MHSERVKSFRKGGGGFTAPYFFMTKIEIFCQLVRDASLLSKVSVEQYIKGVSYILLNARQLTNYIESTDIPMETTVAEYIAFAYAGGPKPRLLVNNGL